MSAPLKSGFSIKQFLPRSLLGRSLLILIVPVLLIQVITTYVFFDRHWSKITSRLAYAVAGEITIIAQSIEDDDSSAHIERVMAFAAQNLDMLVSFSKDETLPDDLRHVYGLFWESAVSRTLAHEMEAQLRRPFMLNVDWQEKWVQIHIQLDNGVLNVSIPQRRLFSSSGYIFLLWMIGSSIVLLSIAILFMRNQIRPIRKLAAAAERFGKGREVATFRPQGAREVRQAGQAFIEMHKRIRRQIEQRTSMLAGVSHDLRTPLTRLKLQLEMMKDSDDVRAMRKDIEDMERMIGGYLDFVRGAGDEQAELTFFNEYIERIVTAAQRRQIQIQALVDGEIYVTLRPLAFERCLNNIIGNAGDYGEQVWLTARVYDGALEIVIEDNGPGIAPDQYEDVFKPFFRVDASRNVATGGVGLGLPIALDIVHGHGGTMDLSKSSKGGLAVTIRIPL